MDCTDAEAITLPFKHLSDVINDCDDLQVRFPMCKLIRSSYAGIVRAHHLRLLSKRALFLATAVHEQGIKSDDLGNVQLRQIASKKRVLSWLSLDQIKAKLLQKAKSILQELEVKASVVLNDENSSV